MIAKSKSRQSRFLWLSGGPPGPYGMGLGWVAGWLEAFPCLISVLVYNGHSLCSSLIASFLMYGNR